ncbi:hypothetical protein GCM10011410_16510 [Hoyosella rhizosphaerae]|uniref:Uncharacterized protein n=1 Tax=Hoyosella rhizosphaerae TaxID=1755582 RepID=A0A916UB71_9ACTN|nr:hypothetical protein GCM10011410_16510 [Hoyosella rhizosphaerae]
MGSEVDPARAWDPPLGALDDPALWPGRLPISDRAASAPIVAIRPTAVDTIGATAPAPDRPTGDTPGAPAVPANAGVDGIDAGVVTPAAVTCGELPLVGDMVVEPPVNVASRADDKVV